MSEQTEELRRLQHVEVQLAEIRRDREAKERRLESRRRQLQKIDEKLEAAARAVRERQMRWDAMQLDLMSREESVARHRQGLNKAKTNKEYAAVLTAMNTEKADNTKVEAAMLELMKEIDAAKGETQQIEAERAKLLEEVKKAEGDLARFLESSRSESSRLESERESFAAHLPPATLEAFARAALRHDGEAMAAVTRPRPKVEEYCCSGCNMKVTLDVVNLLHTKNDAPICGSCGRILYLEPTPAGRR